ncbi:MAG: hypothetical protein A2X94_01920 [Bdellovibrionales bacterium GWB1_55_8]|nr:MAG: hypothetical protein A2X94_01920 [Bdellovibrionales bacterium GWB1_55_8]
MRYKKALLFLLVISLFTSSLAFGADKTLRDTWYTITIGGKIPYGYYNEKLELKKDRLFLQSHVWKTEEDFLNEEQIGAFAEDTLDLKPLFFNFHATYRSTEIAIDGTVKNGNVLSVRTKKGSEQLPIAKRNLPKAAFFSQFFPVWISKHLPELKNGKSLAFTTIPEDGFENGFSPALGRVKPEKPDAFAKESKTQKLGVTYRDVQSFWWVEDSGEAVRIEMPAMRTVVERVQKSVALQFLKTSE